MDNVKALIDQYGLQPHPEGGWYRQTYKCADMISANALPGRFGGDRAYETAIYFLLGKGDWSAFHRIKSDECWHFYSGGSLLIYILHPETGLQTILLGPGAGCHFQWVVPANCWFASEPAPETDYALVGCTVSPGFEFDDFELAKAEDMVKVWPQHETLVRRLCRQ